MCALHPLLPCVDKRAKVAVGTYHTCALFTNGTLFCWGDNWNGALGLGYFSNPVLLPSLVASLIRVVTVAAGTWHTCAVTDGGVMYCWGSNSYGQLGFGVTTGSDEPSPVLVSGISNVMAVSCGGDHTCALTSSGGMYCWGDNGNGELGIGGSGLFLYSPPATPVLTGVAAISTGYEYTCALSSAGAVYCWGLNYVGELGLGYTGSTIATPPSSPVMTGVSQVSAGASHTCALKSGGVYCWGDNEHGQLGNGYANSGASVLSPPSLPVLTGVAAITAGSSLTCALMITGDAMCWGDNQSGEQGNGGTAQVNVPMSVGTSPSPGPSLSETVTQSPTATATGTSTISASLSVSSTASMSHSTSATPRAHSVRHCASNCIIHRDTICFPQDLHHTIQASYSVTLY